MSFRKISLLTVSCLVLITLCVSPLADDCCVGERGHVTLEPNCNLIDNGTDIADLTAMINHLFITFDPVCCVGEADVAPRFNPDGAVDIADLTVFIETLFLTFAPLPECGGSSPTAEVVSRSACLTLEPSAAQSFESECLSWSFADGVLDFAHHAAGMNCCPDYDPVVTVSGNDITIDLSGTEGFCLCLCVFDLAYRVSDLPEGVYQVEVIDAVSLYGASSISFEVDLAAQPSGTVCEPRTVYPWSDF